MNTMFDFLDRIQVQKEPRPEQYSAKMDSSIVGNVIRRFNVGSHLRAKNGSCPVSVNARRKNGNGRNNA